MNIAVRWARAACLVLVGAALVSVPASAQPALSPAAPALLVRVSQGVALRYYLAHPSQAPATLGARIRAVKAAAREVAAAPDTSAAESLAGAIRFNHDTTGLPQDEEAVATCPSHPGTVLGGTNDFRGLLDPQFNFTGWHLSTDGGGSVRNEGLLPPVQIFGRAVPSSGDPVVAVDAACRLFAADLNFDARNPFGRPNGVGVYETTAARLAACPGGSAPSCWPTRRAAAATLPTDILDKPSMAVGTSGSAGEVVWVAFNDFHQVPSAPLGYDRASVKAVRCNVALTTCSSPILISGRDKDIQFSDVTVGPDGRTYLTWSQILGELPGSNGQPSQPQTFVQKLRVAPAGSTTFGPTHTIAVEKLAIPFGGALHADSFRVASVLQSDVVTVHRHPRVFAVWAACTQRVIDTVCEEPQVKMRYSDTFGATWSPIRILSTGGDNYFANVASNGAHRLAFVWYTSRFDGLFHHRQDVELASMDAATTNVTRRMRITRVSNEPDADPLLGGFFIGDYIGVSAVGRTAWVSFTGNYQHMPLLGSGFAIPQQDNYLARRALS